MKFSPKDTVGLVLVAGTLGVLLVHIGPEGHAARHPTAMADGGRSVTVAARERTVAFVDVNVIPMDSRRPLYRQVVLVEGDFVKRIGPVGQVTIPPNAVQIVGDGSQYIVPGLTDAHVHLAEGAESWLGLFVANGVTTVFNLQGDDRHLGLRDRLRDGSLLGPTLYTSGPYTNLPEIETPADAAQAARDQANDGYDFIKVHGELSEDAFRQLVETADEVGIPVVGHAPRNLPFDRVLENGQAGVAHAEELIYTRFGGLVEADLRSVAIQMADAGTWLTPTLSTFGNIVAQWGTQDGLNAGIRSRDAMFLPGSILDDWLKDRTYSGRDPADQPLIEEMYEFQKPLVRVFHEVGVPMLAGTDTPLPVMYPGFSIHDEIAALQDAGLSPFEALSAATANAGRFVREWVDASARFGTVTEGARADLILVGSNPLDDLDLLRRPQGVMVRGQWFDREALDVLLEVAAGNR
jgi:imidazolonepropionase-like amidohydrolase